ILGAGRSAGSVQLSAAAADVRGRSTALSQPARTSSATARTDRFMTHSLSWRAPPCRPPGAPVTAARMAPRASPAQSPRMILARSGTSLIPGLALCAAVSLAAFALQSLELRLFGRGWIDAIVLAILIGAAVRSV